MAAWETACEDGDAPVAARDYAAIWRAAEKIVVSTTLPSVSSARTRIERELDPSAVRELKASSDRDISVGGPNLAAQAIKMGLVDELRMVLVPVVVGGGTPALARGVRCDLHLVEERAFAGGTVYVRYRLKPRR